MIPDAATESETTRNGAFSYAGEFHAFAIGLLVGLAMGLPSKRLRRFAWRTVGLECDCRTDAMKEARAESWYAAGGVAIGFALAIVGQLVALVAIVSGLW